ncbi:MAG: hypothetical protein R3C58_11565 [Parvularculaceae bacterium]
MLYGYYDDDTVVGGAGADTLFGGDGIDVADYSGSASGVSARLSKSARAATQPAISSSKIENLIGSAFDDTLTGDTGANYLFGSNRTTRLSAARVRTACSKRGERPVVRWN